MHNPVTQSGSLPGRMPPAIRSSNPGSTSAYGAGTHWTRQPNSGAMPLAKFLALFSIGLGLAQVMAPRRLSAVTGVQPSPLLMRSLGLREIASGVGILSRKQPSPWLWSRVAGDAMDLALLGLAAAGPRARRNRVAMAAAAVGGVLLLDVLSSVQQSRRERKQGPVEESGEIHIETSIAINKPPQACYEFWRDLENLPRFMGHLESVQLRADQRSHWKARGPAGTRIEWDAEMTADQPGELLAWHSLDGAQVENAGTVRFERAPGGRGTIVRVDMQYRPPFGMAGAALASLFNEEPSQQVADDLRRFKWLIETGVIPTTVGQPAGPRSALGRIFRKGHPG